MGVGNFGDCGYGFLGSFTVLYFL